MDHKLIESARLQRLQKLGRELRELAIGRQGDVEGWRVSRMLRDASTPSEADEAERRYEAWAAGASTKTEFATFTFAARQTVEGWVIDASTSAGRAKQMLGLFITQDAAMRWIADHSADWKKMHSTI